MLHEQYSNSLCIENENIQTVASYILIKPGLLFGIHSPDVKTRVHDSGLGNVV